MVAANGTPEVGGTAVCTSSSGSDWARAVAAGGGGDGGDGGDDKKWKGRLAKTHEHSLLFNRHVYVFDGQEHMCY